MVSKHNRKPYSSRLAACLLCALTLPSAALQARTAAGVDATDALRGMNSAFEALVTRVSPAVVKILVTGYGPVKNDHDQDTALIGRRRIIGSGVIVSPDGYIVTNAHVVRGAQRVLVVLTPAPVNKEPATFPAAARPRTLTARVVGADQETDLAVLKVDATSLPTLPLGDYRTLRQGQIVLAFGSPEGLENTVTMGLISSVLRQPDPDRPLIYIQTDAAINPGNSGGPLVDVDGNIVGINTSILSESGGSEGIGFAIPSVIVHFAYEEILLHGHVHRPRIGVNVQSIEPPLGRGLGLARDWGVIVSDVLPDGPADKAGLKVQDIIVAVGGRPIDGLPTYAAALYQRSHGKPLPLEVLRGSQKLSISVPVIEEQRHFDDVTERVNPDKSLVRQLGILGVDLDAQILELLPELRLNSGVLVAAKAADRPVESDLGPGDIIHAVNGASIESLAALREALDRMKPGDSVAMQVERQGKLIYVAFDLE